MRDYYACYNSYNELTSVTNKKPNTGGFVIITEQEAKPFIKGYKSLTKHVVSKTKTPGVFKIKKKKIEANLEKDSSSFLINVPVISDKRRIKKESVLFYLKHNILEIRFTDGLKNSVLSTTNYARDILVNGKSQADFYLVDKKIPSICVQKISIEYSRLVYDECVRIEINNLKDFNILTLDLLNNYYLVKYE